LNNENTSLQISGEDMTDQPQETTANTNEDGSMSVTTPLLIDLSSLASNTLANESSTLQSLNNENTSLQISGVVMTDHPQVTTLNTNEEGSMSMTTSLLSELSSLASNTSGNESSTLQSLNNENTSLQISGEDMTDHPQETTSNTNEDGSMSVTTSLLIDLSSLASNTLGMDNSTLQSLNSENTSLQRNFPPVSDHSETNLENSTTTENSATTKSLDPFLQAWGSLLHSSLNLSTTLMPDFHRGETSTIPTNWSVDEITAFENSTITTKSSLQEEKGFSNSTLTLMEEPDLNAWNSSFITNRNFEGHNSTMLSFSTVTEENNVSNASSSVKDLDPFLQAWGSLLHASLESPSTAAFLETSKTEHMNEDESSTTEPSITTDRSIMSPEEHGNFTHELNALFENLGSFLNASDTITTHTAGHHKNEKSSSTLSPFLGAWGSLLHAALESSSSVPNTQPTSFLDNEDKARASILKDVLKLHARGSRAWYQSDQNCEGIEAGNTKNIYALKKPSTLCAGQKEGSWLCYCSGRQNDQHFYQYCGNCTATFIPAEMDNKPLKNKAGTNSLNELGTDEKEDSVNNPPKSALNIMATLLAKAQSRSKKLQWEWAPSDSYTPCKAVNVKPVPFSMRRPSAVCENNNIEKACVCARNRGDQALKQVCGKCDYLLRVQTIDGMPVGDQII
jgi:hypothetical protein